jgi:signal transduction histidine kinase
MRTHLVPRSLRRQFLLAAIVLAVLIVGAGATALYSLRAVTDATRTLAQKQLEDMQQAQKLVQQTLLIERESNRLETTASGGAMRQRYAEIGRELDVFDGLADRMALSTDDPAVLDLRQASQLFRNAANVVAQLRESELRSGVAGTGGASSAVPGAAASQSDQMREQMRRQASAMVESAQQSADRYTREFQDAVHALAERSASKQRWMTLLLVVNLLFAWAFAHAFLGRHVLARLQGVSQRLRSSDADNDETVEIRGQDEIAQMARAVEAFRQDRRQLSIAHTALQAERAQQEALILELAEVHGQLLQSEKLASIGQLAAGVAHEINNPVGFVTANLGTLGDYADALLAMLAAYALHEPELSEAARAALAGLKETHDVDYVRNDLPTLIRESMEGLQRVKGIVQGLKDFAHVDTQDRQFASLEKNLESTIGLLSSELKYKAEVVRQYRPIPEVECIPSQLNQVFMNLLVNALQAIDEHGFITVRTGQDGESVWAEVEDTGCGIDAAHLARIFDPFFTTKPVGVGTGLGLSISYSIVKQHGGRIDVKSEPHKGTCFRVVLPLATKGEVVAASSSAIA